MANLQQMMSADVVAEHASKSNQRIETQRSSEHGKRRRRRGGKSITTATLSKKIRKRRQVEIAMLPKKSEVLNADAE
jgi:hypothetical protein